MRHLFPLLFLTSLLAGCQDGPRPGSQPLTEPPAAYPGGTTAGAPAADAARAATSGDPKPEVIWERLGSWTGKQSVQTESFTGLTGGLRVKWEVKGPADGTFLLTIHSSISGRPLQVAVDQKGPGADTAYVNEDPRVFFAVIESDRMEWSFTVDEAMGTRTAAPGR